MYIKKKYHKIIIWCSVAIVMLLLSACSNQPSEEDLRKEIKAEIKAELKAEMESELKAEEIGASEVEDDSKENIVEVLEVDIHDTENVYEVLADGYLEPGMEKDAFENNFEIYYADFDGDGVEDAVFKREDGNVAQYFILSDGSEFKVLDVLLAENVKDDYIVDNINSIEVLDGLIVLKGSNYGNLYSDERTSIYAYNLENIVCVAVFKTSLQNGEQNSCFAGNGNLELSDGYLSLVYSYEQNHIRVENGNESNESQIRIHASYDYDASKEQYIVSEIGENFNVFEDEPVEAEDENTDIVDLRSLNVNDKIDDFTIMNYECNDEYFDISFKGNADIKGSLEYFEHLDSFMFSASEALFTKGFVDEKMAPSYVYDRPSYAYIPTESLKQHLTEEDFKALKYMMPLELTLEISGISFANSYGSEAYGELEVIGIKDYSIENSGIINEMSGTIQIDHNISVNVHVNEMNEKDFEIIFEGGKEVVGEISFDSMMGEWSFNSTETILEKPLLFSLGENGEYVEKVNEIKFVQVPLNVIEALTSNQKSYLEQNGTLPVSTIVQSYGIHVRFGTEGVIGMEAGAYKVLLDEK